MIRSWCHLRRVEDEVAVKWEIVKLGVVGQVQVALKSLFFKAFLGKGANNQNGNLRWHLLLGPPP